MNDAEKYYQSFQQEIIALQESDDEGGSREQLFTRIAVDMLADAGETENTTIAYDEKDLGKRGQHKINGYAVSDNYETVDLFISIYKTDETIVSIPKADIDRAASLVTNFFRKATYNDYASDIDESRPIFDFANQLATYDELKSNLVRVNAFILTNGEYKGNLPQNTEINGVQVFYQVFDINKLYLLSENSRLPIEIDFNDFGGERFVIPCMPASNTNNDSYKAYLAIMSGKCLYKLYEQYGARLLEQNVRSFLQFTGKINKGIRDTIKNEPHMFFAFNNGIAATADHIELDENNQISKIRNLQIVNGGQTTASIYTTAKKDKVDVSDIYVQVKFSVIENHDKYSDIVSQISRYSNTQNKVNDADFSANNPALVAIEKLSRYVLSPITPNTNIHTHWFFERARGQYKTLRSREGFTKAQRVAFDKKYPKEQVFTKVELAKYINAYQEVLGGYNKIIIGPNIVVRGNEKNYARFINNNLPDEKKINNIYFEDAVAKAILFKTAEKRYGTRKNDYCIGELRQVAVPYTISLINYLTDNKLDLYKIWKNQCITDTLSDFIYDMMKQVNAFIIDKSPITHYIEWAKKDECWELVKQHEWNFNIEEIKSDLIDDTNPPKRKILTDDDSSEEEEKHKEVLLRSIPFALWKKIGEWGRDAGFLDMTKQGWASDVAFIIKNNRPFSSRDKSHAMFLFETVFKYNPELLGEADTIAESESQDSKVFSNSSSEEITLELIKRMVDWDRRKRVLEDWKWKAMNDVISGRKPLTDRMKYVFYLNLELLKKKGFEGD
ncbi:MAG: AIPR family protein [Paludibacteraceae bacterium]|nr:AIPR family protein [Paludibacteraceae bacterium]